MLVRAIALANQYTFWGRIAGNPPPAKRQDQHRRNALFFHAGAYRSNEGAPGDRQKPG